MLDEAYIEFAGLERSVARWVPERENLIVLRTFSKWAGIAGLRLGYGIFPGWLMPALWKAKQPYNVNVAATVAGLVSLAHRAEIQTTVDALIVERERLFRELAKFPFLRPYPSQANFVLCRVVDRDAKALKEALAGRGILVRHYAKPGLENCIRVSAGRPEQTDALLAALTAWRKCRGTWVIAWGLSREAFSFMRIVIIASGSRGDVEPYVALGKGLQAAGHVVRLVTHRDFESLVDVARGGVLARRGQRAGRRGKHGGADRERELSRHPGADGQGGAVAARWR